MKAYVTSIGETTTEVCQWQLERLGFEVVLLNQPELWVNKYRRFLSEANEDCLRIDADIIVNRNIFKALDQVGDAYLAQFVTFNFYSNDLWTGSGMYYSRAGLKRAKQLTIGDINRPETSIWRHPEINPHTQTVNEVIGMHGFFQSDTAFLRALKNKTDRQQLDQCDFELVRKLRSLCTQA